VEGALGGTLAAGAIAVLLGPLCGLRAAFALRTGLVVAAAGLCGDLAASWVKRSWGVKDFGTLLPGQGGVLDRFDSFIVAGALALALL
jgi:phosphatidate cytidylyltransferase